MIKLTLNIILILIYTGISAQEFEFKNVTKEELKQKYHPLDSSASAAVLWEKGILDIKYDNGFVYNLEVTQRIKIYNEKGFDYATISLPYYYGDNARNRENISRVKAYVYNLEKNKIKDEKLRNRDIIEEEISDYYKQKKFTFPNLKPGTIIEYTYTHQSPHISELPKWFFQTDIPVNYSEYIVTIPEMLGYKEQQRGFEQLERNTENTAINFDFRYDNSTFKSKSGSEKKSAVVYKYIGRNMPKLKDEPFVNNVNNFRTSIKHELLYYEKSSGGYQQVSSTWNEIAKGLQKSEYFGQQLDDSRYYENDIALILNNSSSNEEKLLKIFDFVKNNIKWNDNLGIYTSGKLKDVYKEKTGSIADINLMLTSMLRYAGLEAHPVLISTINHGIPSNFVSKKDYNYVIASVKLNDNLLLLDASSPYASPNILPIRCINWFGRLIKPDETTKQISLQPSQKSKDNFILNLKLKEDGSLEGQMRRQYTNHLGYLYRTRFTEVDKEIYVENKENDYEIDINEYSNKNIKNLSEAVTETIKFKKENAADVINGEIYFSPLLFLAQDENPFKQDKKDRKLPIDFTFPISSKYMINIDIPDGYKVDYLPESSAVALPEKKALFRYTIQKTGNKIQIMVTEDINVPILPASYYKPLKDYYSQIVNKETDKIVLVKQ
ncbi:MAG: DUF3857 domain-containing protein [Bacteroidetes bacterium]|jgi:transglutaminase-like putative cysteine protease|nr:DUF3857 domain-containing protein [Bacteroidota bacterium]